MNELTRDEFCAVLLESGLALVDIENGRVFATRGPGGAELSEPKEVGNNCNDYRVASFRYCGERKQVRLHRLIWIAANGLPKEGLAVCHYNNDKSDNRIANLYLATPGENSSRAARDGLYAVGEKNGRAKLRDEELPEIVKDYRAGLSLRQAAEKYGISKSRVHQIVTERDWTAINGMSDSARYRMLGNAVAVPVVEWIGRRIVEMEDDTAS